MNEQKFREIQEQLDRLEKLEKKAEKMGRKVIYDEQYGLGIAISNFCFETEDGTRIYEWP